MVGASAFRGTPWLDEQKDEFVIIGDHILLKYNGNQEIVQVPLRYHPLWMHLRGMFK